MGEKKEDKCSPPIISRRRLLQSVAWMSGAMATRVGCWSVRSDWANAAAGPIKVGIATDITGAIAYVGNACANVAKMVVEDVNNAGGILGRPIELIIVDTASNESVGVANVRRLIQRDKVDVVLGGITSSMRNAIKDAIVTRGKTLYIYPEQYEGKECTSYLFCTGPTPAQQCDQIIPWLIKNGGKRFALPSANYIWPRVLNKYARELIETNGGEVIFEEYYPLDQMEYSATVNNIMTNNVEVVFNTIIAPGVGPFFKQLYQAGFGKRGGRLAEKGAARLENDEQKTVLESVEWLLQGKDGLTQIFSNDKKLRICRSYLTRGLWAAFTIGVLAPKDLVFEGEAKPEQILRNATAAAAREAKCSPSALLRQSEGLPEGRISGSS